MVCGVCICVCVCARVCVNVCECEYRWARRTSAVALIIKFFFHSCGHQSDLFAFIPFFSFFVAKGSLFELVFHHVLSPPSLIFPPNQNSPQACSLFLKQRRANSTLSGMLLLQMGFPTYLENMLPSRTGSCAALSLLFSPWNTPSLLSMAAPRLTSYGSTISELKQIIQAATSLVRGVAER